MRDVNLASSQQPGHDGSPYRLGPLNKQPIGYLFGLSLGERRPNFKTKITCEKIFIHELIFSVPQIRRRPVGSMA